jgi:ureidoacrylate peracid hydrolase
MHHLTQIANIHGLPAVGAGIGQVKLLRVCSWPSHSRGPGPTAKVLAAARNAGFKIVYLKMGFRPDLSDMGVPNSPNWIGNHAIGVGTAMRAPDGTQSRILVRDTWNTEIVDDLRQGRSDIVLYKHRYSGFFQTDLDDRLKQLGTRSIIFTGCTTSVCVESTIRDAMFREYSPVLLSDCTAEPQGYGLCRSNHEASLFIIRDNFGWLSTSDDLIRTDAFRRLGVKAQWGTSSTGSTDRILQR